MTENLTVEDDWVPASCTLPTADQPLRRAEFDNLFAEDVLSVSQTSAGAVHLELRAEPYVAARAAGLATKETRCCSFFTFELTITDGMVELTVSAEPEHTSVLAALSERARARVRENS
jgi:hypothetical protein